MTKFAVFFAGALLCTALLTGCGSQQPAASTEPLQEDSLPQYNAQHKAENSVPPAVRERPHLSSMLEDDFS